MFYVHKTLATGRFRFAVRRRRELSSIDSDSSLSTGTSGEFIRHRPEVFYSADHRPIRKPELPKARSIASVPFTTTLIDGTPRGWAFLAMMILGGLFVLLGLALLINKGSAGWVPMILGIALIGAPIVMTAQRRHAVNAEQERKRAERAERDQVEREMLAAYATALDRVREETNDATLDDLRLEREKLDLPYAIWGDAARSTVLQVGFRELAELGPAKAPEIARLMDRASAAAGLVAEDAVEARQALHSTVLWHLLADDRLGSVQLEIVRTLQRGLGIEPADVPIDTSSEEQFERLRGVDHRNPPRCESEIPLGHREFCLLVTPATASDASAPANVAVTNKRFILGAKNEIEIPNLDEIEVDADTGTVHVRASGRKTPIALSVADPIYFASMLSLATTLDDRPKGFM